jgi:hypothetical protein
MPVFVRETARLLFAVLTAPESTETQRRTVARYAAAAKARLDAERDASAAPIARAILLREAVALLVRAVTAGSVQGDTDDILTGGDTVTMLEALRSAAGRAHEDGERRVDGALASRDPLYLDSLEESERQLLVDALEREAAWLRGQIDLRSAVNVRATRLGRQAALVLLLVYGAYALVSHIFAPKNLALHKPVQVSSQQRGTPDPSGLVDGHKGDTYDLATDTSAQEGWATVDLQADVPIHKVVVYNRGDMNMDDCLPYVVELSVDGRQFHDVARRETHFGDGGFLSPPWVAPVGGHARYVRLRAKGYVAVSELEVY